ncbi:MAG TPA: glucans biosynthesis glucosyltransferase MdoH, partial [Xanthobacteraceae bacterium]|nr:glucans biosynthesis glucosyltransferase MdoH [Xanthobacteraceae bacterium]
DHYQVPWRAAIRELAPVTAFGLAMLGFLALAAPGAILWFLPFLAGPILAIPFAVFTSSPKIGDAMAGARLCAIPEEFETPREISTLLAPD